MCGRMKAPVPLIIERVFKNSSVFLTSSFYQPGGFPTSSSSSSPPLKTLSPGNAQGDASAALSEDNRDVHLLGSSPPSR